MANGTWKNKNLQMRKYIDYMKRYEADPVRPTQYHVMSYILFLNDSLASPRAIMNYISGARTWVRTMGGDPSMFDSYPVTLMKRGIQKSSVHTTVQAPPLTPVDIKNIVNYLTSAGPNGPVLTAVVLIAYFTLLRQSNLLMTETHDMSEHALRVQDITFTPDGLNVRVRTTKTRWRSAPPLDIAIPAIPGSHYCPVQAWSRYLRQVKPYMQGPAFITASGLPVTPSALTAVMHLALTAVGHPHPQAFTVHSLRRGGAQACARLGVQLADIQELGTWTSRSVHTYVPKSAVLSAPRTLSTTFA